MRAAGDRGDSRDPIPDPHREAGLAGAELAAAGEPEGVVGGSEGEPDGAADCGGHLGGRVVPWDQLRTCEELHLRW
jgi:hypothetical protein